MPSRKHQIFLCHSSRDKTFVRRLARDLESLQVSVWLDEWELEVGDSLHGCIGKALLEVAYVAVILSPNSINSKWCRDELDQALTAEKREERKIALPLLIEQVQLPPFLDGRLYLEFTRSYYPALAHLAGMVRGVAGKEMRKLCAAAPPTDLSSCIDLLSEAQARGLEVVNLPGTDHRAIRELLLKNGIDVSTEQFTIVPDTVVEGMLLERGIVVFDACDGFEPGAANDLPKNHLSEDNRKDFEHLLGQIDESEQDVDPNA